MVMLLLLGCTPDPLDSDDTDLVDDTDGVTDTDTADEADPWFCTAAEPTVSGSAGNFSVTTEHYALTLQVPDADTARDLGRLAEASWDAFAADFEAEPTGLPLRVGWYSTPEAFAAAIVADGDTPPEGAGGYYSPTTRGAYMWVQPTAYYSATLFLHEMTHQYHFLARTGNSSRPSWYAEGLAEWDSRHDWDGECVRLGRLPLVTQEDRPADALNAITANGLPLADILAGKGSPSRAVNQAIFRFLDHGDAGRYREGWRAFRAEMDAGTIDGVARFTALVGDPATIAAALSADLGADQEPMTPVFVDWVHMGPGQVRSISDVFSATRTKFEVARFEASVPDDGVGGLLVGYDDRDHYVSYLVAPDLTLSTFRIDEGAVSWWTLATIPASVDGSYHLVVDHDAGKVFVDDLSWDLDNPYAPVGGVAVYDSDLVFDDIRWTP